MAVVAEQVKRGDIMDNVPFYLVDPLRHPNARVYQTGCSDFSPDTDVWVIYDGRCGFNPCLKPGIEEPVYESGLSQLISANDDYLRG